MITSLRVILLLLLTIILNSYSIQTDNQIAKDIPVPYDREYTLKATMLGYFDLNGKRNPVLQAKMGETVRIKIVNGELMTHDIVLEKLGIKSN